MRFNKTRVDLNVLTTIEKEFPLCHEYADDARYIWPDRWNVLRKYISSGGELDIDVVISKYRTDEGI